jgi:hypothetical protein
LVPFAAKFGRTPADLANDPELEDRLMDEYARSYGHEPTSNWILVVHPDDSSDFYTFDDPSTMWCCEERTHLRGLLSEEVKASERGAAQPLMARK